MPLLHVPIHGSADLRAWGQRRGLAQIAVSALWASQGMLPAIGSVRADQAVRGQVMLHARIDGRRPLLVDGYLAELAGSML